MIIQCSFEQLCAEVVAHCLPVAVHSAAVRKGGVFVVMPPSLPCARVATSPGGEAYLPTALQAEPGAVVCHPSHLPLLQSLDAHCRVAVVEDVRKALGSLAQKQYGTDVHCPNVIGVTGTNGKTTETYLLEALYRALEYKVGVIGTVSYRWPGHEEAAPLTTPDCLTLHSILAQMYTAGVHIVFMEVSSHALEQNRVAGINFSGALLTNVTQDHLDYHKDMEDYFAAKARLFMPASCGGTPLDNKVCALNADDPYARRLLATTPGSIGFGLFEPAVPGTRHLSGSILSLTPHGMALSMTFEGKTWELSSSLVGSFNVMNLLGAQALGLGMGLACKDFAGLAAFTGVTGRLERVPNKAGLNLFVDYAHTPDALSKVLSALRAAGFARIITVFGCGGNRDRAKRPRMGEAVAGLSDVAVLTSDNPRDESPEAIMADVLPGLKGCPEVILQPDRRKALAHALALVDTDDALLVAGKGHETYQIIKGVRYPFNDQAVLREMLS